MNLGNVSRNEEYSSSVLRGGRVLFNAYLGFFNYFCFTNTTIRRLCSKYLEDAVCLVKGVICHLKSRKGEVLPCSDPAPVLCACLLKTKIFQWNPLPQTHNLVSASLVKGLQMSAHSCSSVPALYTTSFFILPF